MIIEDNPAPTLKTLYPQPEEVADGQSSSAGFGVLHTCNQHRQNSDYCGDNRQDSDAF